MSRRPLPTRRLPEHPNLDQLKHQAKDLRDANPGMALHDAQLALDCQQFGLTTLHNLVARGNLGPEERVAFARVLLDRGARLDLRDNLLKSTPLGWACRWGQLPLVRLFLERGADPHRDGRRAVGGTRGLGTAIRIYRD